MLSLMVGSANAGGEAAHLGGAALGWLLVRNPSWLGFADRLSPNQIRTSLQQSRNHSRRQSGVREENEVDRILDKVRANGLASLTRREKKMLQRATDRKRGAR